MNTTSPTFTFTRSATLATWSNLDGDNITAARLTNLLADHADKITVRQGRHPEQPTASLVAETHHAGTGEPWEWSYVGDDRLKLEAAVATWLLIENEWDTHGDGVPTTLTIWI